MELMRTIFFFCFFQIWLRDSSSELNVLPGAPRTTPGILQVNQFSSHSATFPSSITRRSHKSPHLSCPEYHCLVHQSRERIATAYVSWLHLHCVSLLSFKLWHARVLTVKFSVTLKTSIIDFIVIVFLFFSNVLFLFFQIPWSPSGWLYSCFTFERMGFAVRIENRLETSGHLGRRTTAPSSKWT